jgi:hypothetical protein
MSYTTLAVAFLLVCVGLGSWRPDQVVSRRFAALLAAGMVVAQLALLVLR